MFTNLQKKYDWALPVVRFSGEESMVAAFDDAILAPALRMRRRLNERKAEEVAEIDLDVFPKG